MMIFDTSSRDKRRLMTRWALEKEGATRERLVHKETRKTGTLSKLTRDMNNNLFSNVDFPDRARVCRASANNSTWEHLHMLIPLSSAGHLGLTRDQALQC